MTRKTQTDRTRPTLCHAAEPDKPRKRDAAVRPHNFSSAARSKTVGAAFETRALSFLQSQRLGFVARNVVCRGGEIDLVMREPDGTLVFVEVRARKQSRYGGAMSSIGWYKQQRLVRAAQHYLVSCGDVAPMCRFDVVAFESGRLVWLRDAFRADDR